MKIAVVNTIQIYHSTSNAGQFHTKGHVFIVELKKIKKWLRQWFNIFKHCTKITALGGKIFILFLSMWLKGGISAKQPAQYQINLFL